MKGISGLWCMIVNSVLVNAAQYLASPGEFPYVVVISSKNGTIHAGILITENTVMSDWFTIVKYISIPPREPMSSFAFTEFKIVASNGDWRNDRKKQTRFSSVVSKHPNYRTVKNIPVNNVALIFVNESFKVTPYVVPLSERLGNLKVMVTESISRSLKATNDDEVFVIGGLASSDGKFEAVSPMFRFTTKLVPGERCQRAICDKNCTELNDEEVPLCFEHGGIGGAGSPVLKDLHVVGIGSYIKKVHSHSYLVVTPFQTGAKMAYRILSKGFRIPFERSIFIVMSVINIFSLIYSKFLLYYYYRHQLLEHYTMYIK